MKKHYVGVCDKKKYKNNQDMDFFVTTKEDSVEVLFGEDESWTRPGELCAALKCTGNEVIVRLSKGHGKYRKLSLNYSQAVDLQLLLTEYHRQQGYGGFKIKKESKK